MNELIQNCSYLTPQMAKESGVTKFKFYDYLHKNGFEKVARGIYASGDEWVDELYVIHQRCPKAVFSHDEAFYFHGLIDRSLLSIRLPCIADITPTALRKMATVRYTQSKKNCWMSGRPWLQITVEMRSRCMIWKEPSVT